MNKYLVFGGSGSLGNCLIKHLIEKNIVIISSRDEEKQWRIKNRYLNNKNINFHIGDIRDVDSVKSIIENSNPTHIIIASALKQIDICEKQPEESIMTNIIGIKNIVNIVKKMNNIKTLFVSTDKACSPVNVYGMCKSISEKIVTNQWDNQNNNCFVCVRYGNNKSQKHIENWDIGQIRFNSGELAIYNYSSMYTRCGFRMPKSMRIDKATISNEDSKFNVKVLKDKKTHDINIDVQCDGYGNHDKISCELFDEHIEWNKKYHLLNDNQEAIEKLLCNFQNHVLGHESLLYDVQQGWIDFSLLLAIRHSSMNRMYVKR